MTYLVGWKARGRIYIFADTAVTVPGRQAADFIPHNAKETSFGEANVSDKIRTVYEGQLKISVFSNVIVGFSGHIQTALGVISQMKASMLCGDSPEQAFRTAILSCGPFENENEVGFLVGIPQEPAPLLLAYNDEGNKRITEVVEMESVHMGSMPAHNHQLIAGVLKSLYGKPYVDYAPPVCLMSVLAVLQSFGITTPVFNYHGAGGAYAGVWVDARSVNWQPTTLFVIPNMGVITSGVVDNALVVCILPANDLRIFVNMESEHSTKWRDNPEEPELNWWVHGSYEFAVVLNSVFTAAAVFEMQGKRLSDYLKIETTALDDGRYELAVEMLDGAEYVLTPPSPKSVPDDFFSSPHIKIDFLPFRKPTAEEWAELERLRTQFEAPNFNLRPGRLG